MCTNRKTSIENSLTLCLCLSRALPPISSPFLPFPYPSLSPSLPPSLPPSLHPLVSVLSLVLAISASFLSLPFSLCIPLYIFLSSLLSLTSCNIIHRGSLILKSISPKKEVWHCFNLYKTKTTCQRTPHNRLFRQTEQVYYIYLAVPWHAYNITKYLRIGSQWSGENFRNISLSQDHVKEHNTLMTRVNTTSLFKE